MGLNFPKEQKMLPTVKVKVKLLNHSKLGITVTLGIVRSRRRNIV